MKYKIRTKDCYLNISVRAGLGESFDEYAMNSFARAALRCFMKPDVISRKRIDFSGPIGISLYERLLRPMDKRFFLCILEHIVIAAEKIRSNNLTQDHVVLDLHQVYINEQTKELRFLYIPTDKPQDKVDFARFVEMIVYSVKPAGDDPEFVYRFNNYLKTAGRFEPAKIEKFVSQEDHSVVAALKRQYAGLSGYMTDKPKHYYERIDNEEETNVLQDADETTVLGNGDDTQLLDNALETDLLTNHYIDTEDTIPTHYPFDEDQTGLLEDEFQGAYQDEYEETGLLTDYEDTALYEEEGTCLLQEEPRRRVELYRESTCETIRIQTEVFRLGKSAADYVVNNPAVSRRHAEIIDRGGQYYVIDLGSTNHTYINDRMIPARCETEIRDGDRLRLANENFVFHAD